MVTTRVHRLRFSVRTLLVGVVLVALALGWVKWPEFTTEKFAALVADGQFERANDMLLPPAEWTSWPEGETALDDDVRKAGAFPLMTEGWKENFREPLYLYPRNLTDIILGRRRFGLNANLFLYSIQFTAVRGRIRYEWAEQYEY